MTQQVDLAVLEPILNKHKSEHGALVTMLQEIQQAYGYLPEEALTRLSRAAKIPLSRIYGVITFYSQFYLTPRGKYVVRVCNGTACHVRGSDFIMKELEDSLGIKEGDTTEDLQFSLEGVACFGTCFLAPVMMVNRSYHGKLDPIQARTIAAEYAKPEEQN